MSISNNSTNYEDDFTPAAANGEENGDAINLDNDGQFDGDQQQLKEFREKFAKMEMELKMAKLELENKEQKLKLHELIGEQKALKEKVAKIGQNNEKNANADQLSKILEKISELEKKQKQQPNENTSKATSDQLSEMQNDQKIILEKISEFEKEQRQRKNYWDVNVCDERLEIIGNKKLIVHYKGHAFGSCSVFAKHPILLDNNSPDIFYFEISIGNKKNFMFFGFAVKQQTKLYGYEKGTYAYESDGCVWINGERKRINAQYSYCSGDTVGIGINSATRQIICTKNGLRLGPSYFPVAPFFADDLLYPFVSLEHSGDQIEANFVPIFKFNLKTL
ncbi:hypothetical protein niasHS_005032 [Heterodera schachtii]|uniref:B30.2/SPRY domain-containing protein n=1 Tax=Heterodera schachtii TaxID=97005 RepID=A0ABD2JKC6_HETSC